MMSAVRMRGLPDWIRSGANPAVYPGPGRAADPLADFLAWFGSFGPAMPMAPLDGLQWAGNLPGVTLFRQGAFQVQMFVFPPDTHVPAHRHPHVDTIEMHVAGDYDFRVNGISAIPLDHLHDRRANCNGVEVSRWWGRGVRVRPTDWHDLDVYAAGACFLSVQHWLMAEPSSVGLDWEGPPANGAHAVQLNT